MTTLNNNVIEFVNKSILEINTSFNEKRFGECFDLSRDLIDNYRGIIGEQRTSIMVVILCRIVLEHLYTRTPKSCSVYQLDLCIDISIYIVKYCSELVDAQYTAMIISSLSSISQALMNVDLNEKAFAVADIVFKYENTISTGWLKSNVCLLLCKYDEAWDNDEYKSTIKGTKYWDGAPCDTLMIATKWGIGDLILVMRFLSFVAARVQKIYLQVPARLVSLVKHYKNIGNVIVGSDFTSVSFDAMVDEFTLPKALGMGASDLKSLPAYFAFTKHEVDPWKRVVRRSDAPHIGVIWSSGGPGVPGKDDPRSVGFKNISRLFANSDVVFVGLQGNKERDEIFGQELPDNFIDFGLFDIEITARIMLSLDMVITPCCGMAQLSCALGVKTLALLRKNAAYPWRGGGRQSLWHQSALLFRQNEEGHWDDVIDDVDAYIKAMKDTMTPTRTKSFARGVAARLGRFSFLQREAGRR